MTIEWSISIGNLIQIASIVMGGLFVLVVMREDVRRIKDDVVDMKTELKKVGDILVAQAVATQRIDNLEKIIDEWRHKP